MKLSLAVSYGCMATPKLVKGDDVRVNTDTTPIFCAILAATIQYHLRRDPVLLKKFLEIRVGDLVNGLLVGIGNIMQRNPVFPEAVSYYLPEP